MAWHFCAVGNRHGAAFCNGFVARLRVIRSVSAHAGKGLLSRNLSHQVGQHLWITHAVVRGLNGPYLQCLRVNPQVNLAPLAPVLGPVLLAFLLAFA